MVRPDEEIEFFSPPDPVKLLRKKFLLEKKIIDIKVIISDDQLTKTIITAFESQDAFREYVERPELNNLSLSRREYNETNGIVELVNLFDETGTLLNFVTLKNKK
jgi:hypothetical protein